MQSTALTVDQYIAELQEHQQEPVTRLRQILKETLEPMGFMEMMQYGMMGYVVPYSLYPPGYHCKPAQPLPFIGLAGQKQYIALYHMGIYADPELLAWFEAQYIAATGKTVDMGKSCIRFKKTAVIPYDLIQALATKMTPEAWIATYEKMRQRGPTED